MSTPLPPTSAGRAAGSKGSSYLGPLKAFFWVGGSEGIILLTSLVRAKFVAVLLGPAALGIVTTYASLHQSVRQVFSLGFPTSGARLVASSKDDELVKANRSVRAAALMAGLLGGLALLLFAPVLAEAVLADRSFQTEIRWLAVVVFLESITEGRRTILQGLHRVRRVSALQALCIFTSSVSAVVLYWFFGRDGIVPALLAAAVFNLVLLEYGYRREGIASSSIFPVELDGIKRLIVLGASLALASVIGAVALLSIRASITRELDLTALGLFGAAQALSGRLVTLTSSVVARDFFPRVNAVIRDRGDLSKTVNQQIHLNLALVAPGTLFFFFAAPWLIEVFYKDTFLPGVPLLRWMLAGELFGAVSMPLRFVIIALGQARAHAFIEISFHLLRLLGTIFFVQVFGLEGAGVAWSTAAIIYLGTHLVVVRRTARLALDGLSILLLSVTSIALVVLVLTLLV